MKKDDIIENLKINGIISLIIVLFMIFMPVLIIRGMTVNQDNSVVENTSNATEESKNVIFQGSDIVKVFISGEDRIEEVKIDEYLYGVISSEMSPTFEDEALKSQAIAARTFALNKKSNKCPNAKGADICNTVHCQVYTAKDQVIAKWSDDKKETYSNKIKNAVDSTSGLAITYNGEIIKYPQFFSTSSGKTENCKDVFSSDVPYLVSVESKGEEISNNFKTSTAIPISEFVKKVNEKFSEAKITESGIENQVNVLERSEAGGAKSVKLGGATVKGTELRMLLGLKSTNFTYKFENGDIIFDCNGYGHGVGMSQWGANVMAKSGSDYKEILKHYYTGITISTVEFEE